ncbi:hypothetical protein LSH36_194g05095 [Paralvinella palmiformis]|uniref:VWFA domain-containing protein n=1 Tax=Paralvinella palmiformis TaxID=53620 RepID=A0AAD9JQ99_9ANNE|nr:hypothetical protein LSH36_194g05095 [Paralvinella palmiformis]
MVKTIIILEVLLGLATLGTTTEDGTLTPGGNGSQLVESACDRIQASCIFDDDKLLLRRIAYVESLDGYDPDTYREGYHGGIWQVDQGFFDTTKSTSAEHELYPYIEEIHSKLSIDWQIVTWQDCRRPLVSALAARLYIQYTSRDNNNGIPRDISSQADFWKTYYRTSGSTQDYIDKCNALETGCENGHGADIVFVLDGSDNIGYTHFEEIKEFVKDVVGGWNIGSYQIGVIQYSDDVNTEFNLNDYSTRDQIINAVNNIQYQDGSQTNTYLALERLIDEAFLPINGGRSQGIPKVAIIVTADQSANPSLTISEAERAHRAGIIMLAVGIGSSIDQTELEAIASEPKCLHLFLLSDFNEIGDLKYAIEKRTCEVSGCDLPDGFGVTFVISDIPESGVKKVNAFLLGDGGDDDNDDYYNDEDDQITIAHTPSWSTTSTPTTGYDCDANNPCTPENVEQGNYYFPHRDPDKFVQCDAHGGCLVKHCDPGTVWDPDITACIRAP